MPVFGRGCVAARQAVGRAALGLGWAAAMAAATANATAAVAVAASAPVPALAEPARPSSLAAVPATPCGPDAPVLQRWMPGVWWVPAAAGDSHAGNRGRVANRLVVADGDRTWLMASGPSPAAGRQLACVIRHRLQRRVTDVISPWAHPEAVLGVAGLPPAAGSPADGPPLRHWAHDDVAQAMAERCPGCLQRLRDRLGEAAADLVVADHRGPIRVPDHRLIGDSGHLGPWDWWRLRRADQQSVTVWRLGRARLWFSPGLLNGDGPFDARDTDLQRLVASLDRLTQLARSDGPAAQHLGEQGPPRGANWPARTAGYGHRLLAVVGETMAAGGSEADPAGGWPGLPEAWRQHPWHALNWQRAWRQVEAEQLGAPR